MIVAAAENQLAQIIRHLQSDSQFMARMTGGVFPDLTKKPGEDLPTAGNAPFAYVIDGDPAPMGIGGNVLSLVRVELHDLPAHGPYTISRAAERLERLFDDPELEQLTDSIRVPLTARWMGATRPLPDVLWKTNKIVCTLRLVAH